nr:MAG TPA: hypothetical protein [Caudoviricetes sp.]
MHCMRQVLHKKRLLRNKIVVFPRRIYSYL